jgi:hypothetical protein
VKYGVVLVVALLVSACAGTEPEQSTDETCDPATHQVVVDVALQGLEVDEAYQFVVQVDGTRLLLMRTPQQRNTFGEALLADGGHLIASLGGSTLRVFVDDAAGGRGLDTMLIEVWNEGRLLGSSTLRPHFENAMAVPGDCYSTIAEMFAIPPVQ